MRQETFRRLSAPPDTPPAWRIERKVPLGLLGALALQCAGVVIWATYLEARVEAMERAQAAQAGLSEKFARLEERIDALRDDIARLSRQLDHSRR